MDRPKGAKVSEFTGGAAAGLSQTESEEKKAAVNAEMERVNQLPHTSSYYMHRMRVLNKLLHLLSINRTMSQDEELELLFAGLSL